MIQAQLCPHWSVIANPQTFAQVYLTTDMTLAQSHVVDIILSNIGLLYKMPGHGQSNNVVMSNFEFVSCEWMVAWEWLNHLSTSSVQVPTHDF